MKRPALNLRKLPITPLEMDDEEFTRAVAELQKLAADGVFAAAMAGYVQWLAGAP